MALPRAHLAEENRTHFPFASMFPCIFFLVFINRDIGEVQLVLHCIYTRAVFSGETGRVAPFVFLLTKNAWELWEIQVTF